MRKKNNHKSFIFKHKWQTGIRQKLFSTNIGTCKQIWIFVFGFLTKKLFRNWNFTSKIEFIYNSSQKYDFVFFKFPLHQKINYWNFWHFYTHFTNKIDNFYNSGHKHSYLLFFPHLKRPFTFTDINFKDELHFKKTKHEKIRESHTSATVTYCLFSLTHKHTQLKLTLPCNV